MRTSMAYFAGPGTVIAAIVGGVGGGLLIADMISPKSPKQGTEVTRLEKHRSPEPIAVAATALEPVPFLAASQPSAPGPAVAAAPVGAQAPAQTEAATPAPTPARPVETSASAQPAAPAAQPVSAAVQSVTHDQAAAPDEAVARARDADVKRVVERRKAERHQHWARRQRQSRELIVVEERVRQETEPRRESASEPMKIEMPQISLFGPD